MNLLHVVPSYKPAYIYGGPIESIARLCEGLVENGHIVDVFTTTANGKTELDVIPGRQVVVNGVNVTYFKRITKDHTHISPSLWKQLRLRCPDYDVVHIHSWWNILVVIAAMICHFKKVKVIISPRGMLSDYILTANNRLVKIWLHRIIGRRALSKSYFHATADSEYSECIRLIPGWMGFTQPNILELPKIQIQKVENRVFTLIFLSRIHPKKALEVLFEAISDLPFNVLLKVAGSGEADYVNQLKEKAGRLNLVGNIEWIGWQNRDEKYVELMKADLFVLPSFNENFANVVIESLHMGTPVLISNQIGLASFVQENNLGWISSPDVESIRNSLIDSFNDLEKRKNINRTARSKIQASFSEAVVIQKYEEKYEYVAGKN